jgi:hypothetical protein
VCRGSSLHNNALREIPDAASELVQLLSMEVQSYVAIASDQRRSHANASNAIESISVSLGLLVQLRYLHLGNNRLVAVRR